MFLGAIFVLCHPFVIGGVNLNISPIPRVSDLTIQTVTVDLSQIAIAVQEIAREFDLRLAKADIYKVTLNPLTKLASANPEIVFMGEVNGNPIDTPTVGDEGSIELELNSDGDSGRVLTTLGTWGRVSDERLLLHG